MAPLRVVIVGAGQAGVQAAASLRELGFDGSVTIVGDEPDMPYQRPPLSKEFLTGEADESALALHGPSFYAEKAIELRTGTRAVALDRQRRRLELADGGELPYDHVVLATGARNRSLPLAGSELDGVVALRTLGEAADLRERLGSIECAAVVGGGFIGLELAAVATGLGVEVAVVEALPRVLARAVSPETAARIAAVHLERGTAFRLGTTVERIRGEGGRVAGVETSAGEQIACELVLVAAGVVPNVELAAAAGLPVEDGIVVDAALATSDPAVSAIGDCAAYPSRWGAPRIRLESVQNAVDHGRCVATRLAGEPAPYDAVPWFWSDQPPLRLQIAGVTAGHDETVLLGDPDDARSFSVCCFRDGSLLGVESVGRAADHVAARRLLAAGTPLSPAEAAAPGFELKAHGRPA